MTPELRFIHAKTTNEALRILEAPHCEVGVLLDNRKSSIKCDLEFLNTIHKRFPRIINLLIIPHRDIKFASDAIKAGVILDYVMKPFDIPTLAVRLKNALRIFFLQEQRDALLREQLAGNQFGQGPNDDPSGRIERVIDVPFEYYQSFIDILSYFGAILRDRYPDVAPKVKIEQDGLRITLVIETSRGQVAEVSRTLAEYGLVLTGQLPVDEFLLTPDAIRQFMIKLEAANFQIRALQKSVQTHESERRHYQLQIAQRNSLIAEMALKTSHTPQAPHTKILAILFLDMAGFSQMEDSERREKLSLLRSVSQPLLEAANAGYINTWGDAFVAGFESANDGLTCACRISAVMGTLVVPVRIAMTWGEAVVSENPLTGRGDLDGESINFGARLEPLAIPGQVLVSMELRHHPDVDQARFHFEKQTRKISKGTNAVRAGDEIDCFAVTLR